MSPKSQGPMAMGPPLIPRALSENVTDGVLEALKGGEYTFKFLP